MAIEWTEEDLYWEVTIGPIRLHIDSHPYADESWWWEIEGVSVNIGDDPRVDWEGYAPSIEAAKADAEQAAKELLQAAMRELDGRLDPEILGPRRMLLGYKGATVLLVSLTTAIRRIKEDRPDVLRPLELMKKALEKGEDLPDGCFLMRPGPCKHPDIGQGA